MRKITIQVFLLLILLIPAFTQAQNFYWVSFRDKSDTGFNPYEYFDSKAIERRIRNGVPINDRTDWPVNENYIETVQQGVSSLVFTSRWFNAVVVGANEIQAEVIRQLPFVSSVEMLPYMQTLLASSVDYDTILDEEDASLLSWQLKSLQGDKFSEAGIDGKGVRIAIFDVGFPGAKGNPAFEKIFSEGRVIATRDFSKRKGEDVFWGKSHGAHVWSCIAGQVGEIRMGLATGAEFLLAKTEVDREPFSEELHWMAAAEWADKNGADIINSSLGYTQKRYFPWDMDGKTSYISKAANMAARKGILVVNAAGNEGTNDWGTIGTPADADSVLAIGGIDPETGYHTSFSSYGPSADKRLKPNVSAFGHVIVSGESGFSNSTGTSFASPLVAGFAACVLQLRKETPCMDLFHLIEKSGNLYPYFDYAHGFGMPQAGYFTGKQVLPPEPTFTFVESEDSVKVMVNNKLIPSQEWQYDNWSDGSILRSNLYYNITNEKGVIDSYYVVAVTEEEVLVIDRSEYQEGETLVVHFAGYTASIKL
ncbi:MAG: S8 family serine peptidase [Bacteroidales bacterium]|nr:S8 family serine peptidase [Bacteroidales bacterium]